MALRRIRICALFPPRPPLPLREMALLKYNSYPVLIAHLKFRIRGLGALHTNTGASEPELISGWKRRSFCTAKKVAGPTERQFSEEAVGSPGVPETLDRDRAEQAEAS